MSIPKPVVLITSIFLLCSPSLAASDAEIAGFADKMSGAFKCSIYASLFKDQKEQQRLFQIGLKAARNYVEGLKSRHDLPRGEMMEYFLGVSTDFVVGTMYDTEAEKAYDDIPQEQRYRVSEDNTLAKLSYRNSNCSLIQ